MMVSLLHERLARFMPVRWIRRSSQYFGSAGHPVRRWLVGWRALLLTVAAAGLLTAAGLILQEQHGEYVEIAYQAVARLAGAACLTVMLVAITVVVDWLHQLTVTLQRHIDRALSGYWGEKSRALWRGLRSRPKAVAWGRERIRWMPRGAARLLLPASAKLGAAPMTRAAAAAE
jgi:hypothetical protein